MNKPPLVCRLIPLAIFLCLLCSPAQAQDQDLPTEFLSSHFGTIRGWLEYSVDHDFQQGVSDQPSEFSLTEYYLRVPGFRWLDQDHEFLVGSSLRILDVDTDAMFPDTAQSFPEYFANPELILAYKQRIAGAKIWGASLTLGSPSDRPFASIQEVAVDATAFLRLPVGQGGDAWLLFINYSNARPGLQHIPLPGIAYVYEPSEDFLALVGVPFTFINYKPSPRWTLRASYILPRDLQAKASYELSDSLTLYSGFDWGSDIFFRHDRHDDEDRLFFYKKTLSAGIRWELSEDLYLDFSAGYRFDRFFFEGEDYDDRSFNRIDVGDGAFLALRVALALDQPTSGLNGQGTGR